MTPDSEPTRGKEQARNILIIRSPFSTLEDKRKAADECQLEFVQLGDQIDRLRAERDTFQKVVVERDKEIAGLKAQRAIKAIENICEQCGGDKVAEVGCIECEQGRWQEAIYTLLVNHAPDNKIDGAGSDSGDPLDFTLAEIQQALGHIEGEHESLKAELSALKKRDEWVSVKERLPPIGRYQAYFENGRIESQTRDHYMCPFVTHWKPLPEPPKRGRDEG